MPDGAELRLGSRAFRHTGPVLGLAWSKDGAWIASNGQDRRVRLFDAESGADGFPPIELPKTAASRVSFSADGRTLFVADREGGVAALDVFAEPRGKSVRRVTIAAPTPFVAPDGTIAGFDRVANEIDRFDAEGKPLGTLKPPLDFITRVAFSADSRRLAVGGFVRSEGRAKEGVHLVLEVESGKVLMSSRTPETWPQSIAIAPDGTRLWSGCVDGSVRAFDVESGAQVGLAKAHEGLVTAIVVSADGKTVASGGADRRVAVLDAASVQVIHAFPAHASSVNGLAFSPDGGRVASGGNDGIVRIFTAETGELVPAPPGHAGGVTAIAPSKDGARVVTASFDGTVRVWNAKTGALEKAGETGGGFVLGARWSAASDRIVAVDQAGGIVSLDRAGGTFSRVPGDGTNASVAIDFAPDGRRVVVAGTDNVARIVDLESGEAARPIHVLRGMVHCAAWSPDGATIVLGTSELLRFDAATGAARPACEPIANPIASLAFFPDSKQVALACGDERVRIVDVESGKIVLAPVLKAGRVQAVAVSPDGRTIAAASNGENVVRLLDAATGAPAGTLAGHDAPVISLAFSADGRLWSGSMDATVLAWRLPARAASR